MSEALIDAMSEALIDAMRVDSSSADTSAGAGADDDGAAVDSNHSTAGAAGGRGLEKGKAPPTPRSALVPVAAAAGRTVADPRRRESMETEAVRLERTKMELMKSKSKEMEAVALAISEFECPEGFELYPVPSASDSRSPMYSYGVRVLETGGGRNRGRGRFYCLASKGCRGSGNHLSVKNGNSSPVTNHLRDLHCVVSKKSEIWAKTKDDRGARTAQIAQMQQSKVYNECKDRFLLLEHVKAHTIGGFEAFDYMEDPARRASLLLASNPDQPFPVAELNAKRIKRAVVELYDATKQKVRRVLQAYVKKTPIPFLHLTVAVWKASPSVSEDKYLGLRVSLLTEEFQPKAFLLALRLFNPAREISPAGAGELVKLWTEQVLEEYGLGWRHVLGAVIAEGGYGVRGSGGGRVGRGSGLLPGTPIVMPAFSFSDVEGNGRVLPEVCIPHVLSLAVGEALGLSSVSPGEDGNAEARDLLRRIKRIVEDAEEVESERETAQNPFDEVSQESHGAAVPEGGSGHAEAHRWISLVSVLERYLVQGPGVSEHREGKELLEIYSILKPLSLVIQACHQQSTTAPPTTSLDAIQEVIILLSGNLNRTSGLALHDPAAYFSSKPHDAGKKDVGVSAAGKGVPVSPAIAKLPPPPPPPPRVVRAPQQLTPLARKTRELAGEAIFESIAAGRWGSGFDGESHLYDMALALNPSTRGLGYMAVLSRSASVVPKVKAKVWAQIEGLVRGVVAAERAEMAATKLAAARAAALASPRRKAKAPAPAAPAGGGDKKRRKFTPKCSDGELEVMARSGLWGGVGDGDGGDGDGMGEVDSEEEKMAIAGEARERLACWRAWKVTPEFQVLKTGREVASFWETTGRNKFRAVSIVARSVLAAPASPSILDRDFVEPARLMERRPGPLGSAFVEMAMFLRGVAGAGLTPDDVPELNEERAAAAIPRRLRDPRLRERLRGLLVDDDGDAGGRGRGR